MFLPLRFVSHERRKSCWSRSHVVGYMDFRLYNRSKCPNTLIESPVFYKQAFVNLDFTLPVILPRRCLGLFTQCCICLCYTSKQIYKILTIYERAKALCEALLTLSENRRNVLIVQIILNDMSLRYMKLKLDKSALREAAPNPQLISHFVFQHHLAPLFSMTMCQI